jgi:S-disulfanyl-L-cysteine oxidoreductase SoxD
MRKATLPQVAVARRSAVRLLSAAALAAAAMAWLAAHALAASGAHFADADDLATVQQGKKIYMGSCANCHGRNLQGQPLWQLIDQFAGRRAPAHDETGHTWQHSDEDFFHMTKYGRFAAAPPEQVSYMPPFKDRLSDDEILAVMAFIKARWPLGLRVSQALLNPGFAGMPAQADQVEWRLPPTCRTTLSQASAAPAKSD